MADSRLRLLASRVELRRAEGSGILARLLLQEVALSAKIRAQGVVIDGFALTLVASDLINHQQCQLDARLG